MTVSSPAHDRDRLTSATSGRQRAGRAQRPADYGPDRSAARLNLREIVLGAQDGLTTTLGVALGVAVGTGHVRTVALAGLASAITQSLSMGAVVYTSSKAERDVYLHAEARERRQIEHAPHEAREDVRLAYARQGFEGAHLQEIVTRLTSDKDLWARTMVTAELGLAATPPRDPLRRAMVTYLSSLVGALIPLIPFAALSFRAATLACGALSVVVLFGLGSWKARITERRWWRDGLQLAIIAGTAGLAAAGIGALLKA